MKFLFTLVDCIGKSELVKLYTDKLVNKKEKARIHYDRIIMSANGGICPYCSQGIVKTLDHFLPKDEYPIYSITPLNLIPSCRDCNIEKSTELSISEESTHLHPYYDNVEHENWLKMRINNSKDLIFDFYIECPKDWNPIIEQRLNFHFATFDLYNRYSKHSAQMFENNKKRFGEIFSIGGCNSLKEHLMECYSTKFHANKNSWQTAFYFGLYNNDWFCNGGFV